MPNQPQAPTWTLRPFSVRDARGTVRRIGVRRSWRCWPWPLKLQPLVWLPFWLLMLWRSTVAARVSWSHWPKHPAGMHWWDPVVPWLWFPFAIAGIYLPMALILAPAVAKEVRRRGECPVCGYDLRAQEPEADGCVVCPECAAAWNGPS